jgi:hypothetical protein
MATLPAFGNLEIGKAATFGNVATQCVDRFLRANNLSKSPALQKMIA